MIKTKLQHYSKLVCSKSDAVRYVRGKLSLLYLMNIHNYAVISFAELAFLHISYLISEKNLDNTT